MAPIRRYMSTAAKVAEQKRMCPQFYCAYPKCLWRVRHMDGRETPCPHHHKYVPQSPLAEPTRTEAP